MSNSSLVFSCPELVVCDRGNDVFEGVQGDARPDTGEAVLDLRIGEELED